MIQDILLACMTLVAVAAFCGMLLLWVEVYAMKERLDVLDDAATPSFKDPAPKTAPDLKQAHKVPPPGTLTKEFAGPDGTVRTFQFGGES